MMETFPLTSSNAYWAAAAVMAVVNAGFLALLLWRLPAKAMLGFRRMIVLTSVAVWLVLNLAVFWGDAWSFAYALVLPPEARWVMPLILTVWYTIVAYLLLEWVPRLKGHPAVWFVLLGAAAQSIQDLWELFGLGMLHVVPALREVSAASVLVYSALESVLLWAMILALAPMLRGMLRALLDRLGR